MWATSLAVADACYVLLVLIGGILVMSHETLQTSYSVKEIAPRIVLGFVGANLSMVVISQAITIANGLSAALAGHGVTPATAAASLMTTLGNSVSTGGIFLILLALAGVVLALVLAVVYVMRLMAVVLLAAAAPLALALYALPQTAWAARWWWRALTAALAIQVAQGLVLTAAVQVFFAPGWLPWHLTGYLEQVLITLCLLWVLMRIPFWVARPVAVPVRPLPAAPRRPVRRHRRRAVPGRAAAARRRVRQRQGRRFRERKERKRPVSYEVSDPVPIPADVEHARQDPGRADRPAGGHRRGGGRDHLAGLGGRPPRPAAAGVRGAGRPGRAGRHRAGDRRAGRAAPGPAAGRRVAPGPLAAPPGHRPRGHPGPAGLGRAARPAAPAPAGAAGAAVAAHLAPTG